MKIIDIHTHGGYGVNFNSANATEISFFAREIKKRGVLGFCPTLATDTLENISRQLNEISLAQKMQKSDESKILGAHLEALFLNPKKKGIHNEKLLLTPSVENFKKLEHAEVIKIATIALELDEGLSLRDYLRSCNIKVQLGHSTAQDILGADGTTHHFNAMPSLHHREESATLKALFNEDVYCEIIADTKHVSVDMLKLFFKTKEHSRILLVSDSLAIAHSGFKEMDFCGTPIMANGQDANHTLGGSILFLDEIINQLDELKILDAREAQKMAWENVLSYLQIQDFG